MGETGLGKGIIAGPQSGHKEIGGLGFAGERVLEGDCLAGIIDEEFFSGPIFLTQANVELLDSSAVKPTKLAVLVAV